MLNLVNAACVTPTVGMTVNGPTTFCPGDYYVTNITVSGPRYTLEFNNTNLFYNDSWGVPNQNQVDIYMITFSGADTVTLDCDDGAISGYWDDSSGNEGTGAIHILDGNDYISIDNCNITTHMYGIMIEDTVTNTDIGGSSLYNMLWDSIRGGGNNLYVHNIDSAPYDTYVFFKLWGYNHMIDSADVQHVMLGEEGAPGTSHNWTGSVINSFKKDLLYGGVTIYRIGYGDGSTPPYYMNISNNGGPAGDFDVMMWGITTDDLDVGDFNNSNQYIYGNQLFMVRDSLDYSAGQYFTWCVNGIGNLDTYPPYEDGPRYRDENNDPKLDGDPYFGDCCYQDWECIDYSECLNRPYVRQACIAVTDNNACGASGWAPQTYSGAYSEFDLDCTISGGGGGGGGAVAQQNVQKDAEAKQAQPSFLSAINQVIMNFRNLIMGWLGR